VSQQRSIEVKVGVLILVALALLGVFIVVMGGVSFEPTYRVNVDFTNPGGLKAGAPLRLSGVRVGKVVSVEFRGEDAQAVQDRMLIRVVVEIDKRYQKAVHDDARWFISTQGVLGEFFLAVDPGSPAHPVLPNNAVVQGISPPRLDLLLSEAYELLHHTYVGISENQQKIQETFDGLHLTLKGSGRFFERNSEKLDRIVDNLEQFSVNANQALTDARSRYVDNPKIDRILSQVERSTSSLDQNLNPLLKDTRNVVADVSRLSAVLGSEEQLKRYREITQNTESLTQGANQTLVDTQQMLSRVKDGKGTVGALIKDEAVYDDLQELLRELKHNPWKLFWRE
jgi:phospholipid/cholesterol/gamma-HCH transport system substrate-binding protein